MINDESIATAQIAQIFGSELLKAQQSARTDGGAVPDFVRVHPQQFLVNTPEVQARKKEHEARLMQLVQQEAESSCPLPESSQSLLTTSSALETHSTILEPNPNLVVGKVTTSNQLQTSAIFSESVLERIATSLESIAASLEKVDISTKRRKIKRPKHSNEANPR